MSQIDCFEDINVHEDNVINMMQPSMLLFDDPLFANNEDDQRLNTSLEETFETLDVQPLNHQLDEEQEQNLPKLDENEEPNLTPTITPTLSSPPIPHPSTPPPAQKQNRRIAPKPSPIMKPHRPPIGAFNDNDNRDVSVVCCYCQLYFAAL